MVATADGNMCHLPRDIQSLPHINDRNLMENFLKES
jgi:hypothetical protein